MGAQQGGRGRRGQMICEGHAWLQLVLCSFAFFLHHRFQLLSSGLFDLCIHCPLEGSFSLSCSSSQNSSDFMVGTAFLRSVRFQKSAYSEEVSPLSHF